MPKTITIDPVITRKPGEITFPSIKMNAFQKNMNDVKNDFTHDELIGLYYDMRVIREFETMLQDLRLSGEYQGSVYDYTGPSHLCIGQESVAVGQAYALDTEDIVFGSHRSHGEVIAKGFSAIRKFSESHLNMIMKVFHEGTQLSIVKDNFEGNTRTLCQRFFLYGLMAEIFGRETGFSKGLGNSMHVFFVPFGIFPNNAIVGGSAPIATGAALYKKVMKKSGIIVANSGDGSLGCGPVWESFNFAGMDQFTTLWDEKGGLPVLFSFNNNGYGMGGQTSGETMSYKELARVGAGINPSAMHSERLDGFNIFAVIDGVRRKKKLLEEGQGPALLDVITYRFSGHSTSDTNPNRTREEIASWEAQDAMKTYASELLKNEICTERDILALDDEIKKMIHGIFLLATSETISPRMNLLKEEDAIEKYIFSNQHILKMEDGEPIVLAPKEENPRVKRLKQRSRSGMKDGKPLPSAAVIQNRDVIFEALHDKFYEDPTLISYGEDLRIWGSAYGAYKELDLSVPYSRLFNTPISESAIISSAVGYAMMGGRVVPELMYCDFLGRAGDEVFNQLAKWQAMTAGQLKMPVVVRMGVGSKYGAQHSQDWSSLCAHVPGLKVVFPVTPYDTKGLLNAALAGTDPVIFLEHQSLYGYGELFQEEVPKEYYEIPIGEPDVKRRGSDLTILTIGKTLYAAVEAAKIFEEKYSIQVEIIDARTVVPFNFEPVIRSVKKTGKIIIASDACQRGSMVNDFAQNISSMAFDYLDAPPLVLGARNWITPVYELEKDFFPQPSWFLDLYHQKIKPLKDHVCERTFNTASAIVRGKIGV